MHPTDRMDTDLTQSVGPNDPTEPVGPVYHRYAPEPPAEPGPPEVMEQPVVVEKRPGYLVRSWSSLHTARVVYFVLGILEVLIGIRVVLRLLGANSAAGFTSLIYGITAPFVALFQGVFPNVGAGGSVLELSSLLAMLVYALLAWAIVRTILISAERRPPRTA